VFAEAYDPEDDEGKDDVKVKLNFIEKDELFFKDTNTSFLPLWFQTVHPKTDEQRQRLAEAVKDCLLFR
jgi:hypothetical protein